MTFRMSIWGALIFILLSCNSNSSSPTPLDAATSSITDSGIQTVIHVQTKEQYANIDSIFQKDRTTFLYADYIQLLTGDAAIEAAKKAHKADTFQIDGKTHIGVPNDYFILNEHKRIRQLPLAKDCEFDLIINPDRMKPIADNSLKSLQTIYSESPFILTLNDEGVVVKVKEVFLP